MNAFLSIISNNGIYIFPSMIILITIAVLAIANAENFPYPDECFNCRNRSCGECGLSS